jgi:hypothetical protein
MAKKKKEQENKTISKELENVLNDLDLNSDENVLSKNHAKVGDRVKFFIKKQKDDEVDFIKANPKKHVSHETVDTSDKVEKPEIPIVQENSINIIVESKPVEKQKPKKWFGFIESEDNITEKSSENNDNAESVKTEKLIASTEDVGESKKVKRKAKKIENISHETSVNTLNDEELRGFAFPSFNFNLFKRTASETVSYETTHAKGSFWKRFSLGIFFGCLLFAFSLLIGKYAGKVLNPNISEALTVSNIDQFVMLGENSVSPETPKVFKVTDLNAEIFKNPIFKSVSLGDLVLVYEKIGKIVVFRQIQNKIVSVISL